MNEGPRPRDYALMRLAAAGGPPRKRARDQQADLVGASLEHAVLEHVAASDPVWDELDAALVEASAALPGSRGVALLLRDEWLASRHDEASWSALVAEALEVGEPDGSS